MQSVKSVLRITAALVLAALVVTIAVPGAASAVTAALVQVTNTSANPVPVTVQPSTTTVAMASANVGSNSFTDLGTFDVSQWSSVRFYGDPASPPTFTVRFLLTAVDAHGNRYALDTLQVT